MKVFIILFVMFLVLPAFGQTDCDFSIADIITLINAFNSPQINYNICDNECDPDEDGLPLSIADVVLIINTLIDPNYPDYSPDFSRHPEMDTLSIGSSVASPGEQLSLPIFLKTVDTLTAFQFYVEVDSNYIEIIDFDANPDIIFNSVSGLYNSHGFAFNGTGLIEPIMLLPGEYYLGDLVVSINDDIDQEVTSNISFTGCHDVEFYTGFANLIFFEPVLIDGEITITPTGIENGMENNLPQAVSIIAYPNPFNSSVNLRVQSERADGLIIYDILGREINRFQIQPGLNLINWDGRDKGGNSVNSGIYFAGIQKAKTPALKKLLFIK